MAPEAAVQQPAGVATNEQAAGAHERGGSTARDWFSINTILAQFPGQQVDSTLQLLQRITMAALSGKVRAVVADKSAALTSGACAATLKLTSTVCMLRLSVVE
jgi:hypothetical protein